MCQVFEIYIAQRINDLIQKARLGGLDKVSVVASCLPLLKRRPGE